MSAVVGGDRLAVAIEFDEAGDFVRASCQTRKRKVEGNWRATPWGGEFRDYADFDGLRLPQAGEAYWDLPEGRYVYWRGEITGAEVVGSSRSRS